jgi:GNAT superfamily N-acetyltransferase
MIIRELNGKEEMLKYIDVLQDLYPTITLDEYSADLDQMLPHNYGQVAVFEDDVCLGISGFWIGTKLWCGKYLELDNIVVRKEARSKGVGQVIFDYLTNKAMQENCHMMSLDSYTSNYKAHKFFYNNDFAPKGFHFIRILKENKIR